MRIIETRCRARADGKRGVEEDFHRETARGASARTVRQARQREERMALTHRYAEAMSAPIDLPDETSAERRGELMLAVSDLMQCCNGIFCVDCFMAPRAEHV